MNCPNCAAPLKPYQSKCEYCGSYYIDTTMFDLDNRTPTYMKMKYQGKIVTLRVFHFNPVIEFSSEYTDITDGYGNVVKSIKNRDNIHLNFEADCDKMYIEQGEKR